MVLGRGRGIFCVVLVACTLLGACSSSRTHTVPSGQTSVSVFGGSGSYIHTVRPGETLSEIAQRYNTSTRELARTNRLRDPNQLEVGQELRLPSSQSLRTAAATSERRVSRKNALEKQSLARVTPDVPGDIRSFPRERESREGGGFSRWPVEGNLTSRFGPRDGSFHDGIDIAAPTGASVSAVADGEVIFSNVLHGYGNLVILRHRNGLVTVYAHNSRNVVNEGDWVRRGQIVAKVGQTGRASGPHLHFEVRKDNQARNPLRYLPEDTQTASRDR